MLPRSIILSAFLTLSLLVSTQESAAGDVRKFTICRNGKTVRTIRVEKDPRDNQGWITLYTKSGKDEVVGEGLNPSSCEDVLVRVQQTLEKNQWKCRDVSGVQVHRTTASTAP